MSGTLNNVEQRTPPSQTHRMHAVTDAHQNRSFLRELGVSGITASAAVPMSLSNFANIHVTRNVLFFIFKDTWRTLRAPGTLSATAAARLCSSVSSSLTPFLMVREQEEKKGLVPIDM